MRIASKIGFGERPSDTRTLVKRYFMAFEGKIDEFNYFTGLFYHLRKIHGTELSSKQLLNNPKEGKYTYVTQRLREVYPSYKKGNVRFVDFENDLFAVIKNAQLYATSLEDLKNKVGTNLPEFLQIFITT